MNFKTLEELDLFAPDINKNKLLLLKCLSLLGSKSTSEDIAKVREYIRQVIITDYEKH